LRLCLTNLTLAEAVLRRYGKFIPKIIIIIIIIIITIMIIIIVTTVIIMTTTTTMIMESGGSSVIIVTRLGTRRPGIDSWKGQRVGRFSTLR